LGLEQCECGIGARQSALAVDRKTNICAFKPIETASRWAEELIASEIALSTTGRIGRSEGIWQEDFSAWPLSRLFWIAPRLRCIGH
jgi:hypothetical protein